MVSPWLDHLGAPAEPLHADVEVDVAVIGAGYAGLSAALALRAERMSVAVLEAQVAGFGASGRNAGHLTPTIGKDLPTLTRVFGRERVQALVQLADASIGEVEGLIQRHRIACDYEPVGNIVAAIHPRQYRNLDRAAAAAAAYGVPGEILEPEQMRRRGLPPTFPRGYFEPHGGILDPGRYVRGLREAVLQSDALLYENSPVTRIEDSAPCILHTPRARVRAGHVVVATNAYTPSLGILRSAALPLHVQLFRTAPLSDAQRARLDWHGREGIYTAHEMLESYRWTPDNRILGGAKLVRYGYAGRTLPDVDPRVAAALEAAFRDRFPDLRDVQVTGHWGGPIGMTLDFLPALGRTGRHRNVLYAIAYAGHGLALASYAGRLVADLLLERRGPGTALSSRWRFPLPPEPFRWLVVRGLTALFRGIDRRIDRRCAGSHRAR